MIIPRKDGANISMALRLSGSERTRITQEIAKLPAQMPAELMRDGMSNDFSDRIAAGSYPLLFIHAHVPADLARLQQLRPDAIVATVAASGHFLTLIVPDQVSAMLDRFLAILPLVAAVERVAAP